MDPPKTQHSILQRVEYSTRKKVYHRRHGVLRMKENHRQASAPKNPSSSRNYHGYASLPKKHPADFSENHLPNSPKNSPPSRLPTVSSVRHPPGSQTNPAYRPSFRMNHHCSSCPNFDSFEWEPASPRGSTADIPGRNIRRCSCSDGANIGATEGADIPGGRLHIFQPRGTDGPCPLGRLCARAFGLRGSRA